MPIARDRMLELSELATGSAARTHFLSITQSNGSGSFMVNELGIEIEELSVEINSGIDIELESY